MFLSTQGTYSLYLFPSNNKAGSSFLAVLSFRVNWLLKLSTDTLIDFPVTAAHFLQIFIPFSQGMQVLLEGGQPRGGSPLQRARCFVLWPIEFKQAHPVKLFNGAGSFGFFCCCLRLCLKSSQMPWDSLCTETNLDLLIFLTYTSWVLGVWCTYQCTIYMLGAWGDQKRVLDAIEVKLQIVVNCYVCGGNWTWVLRKSRQFSSLQCYFLN